MPVKRFLFIVLLFCTFFAVSAAHGECCTPGKETCGKENCFWETPMDITDEETIWKMLMQPMTIIKGDPRSQFPIYEKPDKESKIIGEVTCDSQGVHVIETLDNGWAKVECYSSSFKGSDVEAYNLLVTGYLPADFLQERKVKTAYGLVVDKFTQRLYLFHEGKLLDTLLVSTGLADEEHPWNETRSGEYVLNSRSGAFPSEKLICNYGIRYNDGDLIHEVPHIPTSSGKNYSTTEPKLGSRASHGCIRVQRKRTPQGINMRWLWDALKGQMGTRIVIWEDWQGRQLPIPDDGIVLYYNADGGQNYHCAAKCYGVRDEYLPLVQFTYGDLETAPFSKLGACPYCNPPLRVAEIKTINAAYAANEDSNGNED